MRTRRDLQLRHFYADVRQDPLIGPIFNAKIKDLESSPGTHHIIVRFLG